MTLFLDAMRSISHLRRTEDVADLPQVVLLVRVAIPCAARLGRLARRMQSIRCQNPLSAREKVMPRARKLVLLLMVAPVLLPAQFTTAAKDERSKSRSATGTLRLSPSYDSRVRANSSTGKKALAPNRSRSIVERVKRTYSEAEQKRRSEAARRTREIVELYKQAEERKTRKLLREIKQSTQRSANGSLTLKQPSEARGSSNGAMGSKRLVKKPILIPPRRDEQETKVLKLFAPSSKAAEKEKESKSKKKLKGGNSKKGGV
jgi:hypothetical protein